MSDLLSHPWWLLLLAATGVIAIVGVILGLFSNFGEEPDTARVTRSCAVTDPDFLAAVSGSTNAPVHQGGSARLHNNGAEFFPAIFAALEGAKRTINFMVYIWEPGEVSDRVFDILIERAGAGVEVRVMADGMGGHRAPGERIHALREAGGQWCWFHPLRFGEISLFHKRNHRRAIIVDGRIGFVGGAAVADKWLGNAESPERWRDVMLEVRGPIASNLQPAFVQLWSNETGELLTGPDFFPGEDAAGGPEDWPGSEHTAHHVSLLSSPSTDDFPLRRVFWLTFGCARRSIHITNPYFVPDKVARTLLMDRAREGVDVQVLVPNEHIDVRLVRWASHSYYEELLQAGVRIWEYQPTMVHHKQMVVDARWSIVGSANMDVRSKELNQENVLGILDEGFAATVERDFQDDLRHAREITLDEWRRRPLLHRLPERVGRMFEEQV